MLRQLRWFAGDCEKRVLQLMTLAALITMPVAAQAVPIPVWSNSLDDNAATTAMGGTIQDGPDSYVPGAIGDAFAGNGR